jgi:hypothetical protein
MFIVPVPPEVPVGGTLPQKLVTGPPVTARARPQSNGPARRANCAARRTSYGDRFSYGRWACEAGSTESIRPVRRRRDTQSTGRALICFQMGEGCRWRTFQGHFDAMVLVVVSALAYSALVGCSNSGQSNLSGSASQPSASRSPAEPTDANRLSRSQAVLDQAVQSSEPGCSAAVGRRGEILWTGVAGVSNVQRRDPITADTVFDAGSVSKQFTATAVLLLQQEGKLSVDDRLSRHVDGLPAWSDQVRSPS